MATAPTATLLRAICSSVLESLLEKKGAKSITFKYEPEWRSFSSHCGLPRSLHLLESCEKQSFIYVQEFVSLEETI